MKRLHWPTLLVAWAPFVFGFTFSPTARTMAQQAVGGSFTYSTDILGLAVCAASGNAPSCPTWDSVDGDGDGDVGIAGELEVDGNADFDGDISAGNVSVEDITGENGGVITNSTDGAWSIGEASEDLVATFTSDTVTLTSTTGVASLVTTGIALSVTVVDSTNQACNTTCGVALCIVGTDGTDFVGCADATADSCLCTGAAS